MFKKNLNSLLMLAGASALFALPPRVGSTNYKASSINNFDFNLSWENLKIESADGNDIVVEIYCNKKRYAPTVKTLHKDTLIIESVPSLSHFFIGERRNCTVIVQVPDGKQFDNFTIHTSSGNINCSTEILSDKAFLQASSGNINIDGKIISKTEVTVKTSSGDSFVKFVQTNDFTASANSGKIAVDLANSKMASLQASSGDIFIKGGSSQKTEMSASSGNITCSNYSGGKTETQTTSGNIKLNDVQATSFDATTSSGNITARDLGCQSFDVSTASGTIGLELIDAPVGKSSMSSSSGTQFISMPHGSRISLHVTTSSGSFTNAFTKEKISSHADYNKAINGGGAKVHFSSSSGSITLDEGDGVASDRALITDDDPVITIDRPIF